MENPLVSVIAIAYNDPSVLVELLDTIYGSSYRNIEVIVTNNSIADYRDEYEKVLEGYPGVTHLWNGENLLISGALNRGVDVAKGELLLCCGDDYEFDQDMIKSMVEFMSGSEDAAIAGPVLYHAGSDEVLTAGHSISLSSGLLSNPRSNLDRDIEVEIIDGIFMVRASALKEIGKFDEKNFPFYLESADLCMRARRSGYKCVTVVRAKAWHKYLMLTAGIIPDPDRYGENAATYYYLMKTKIRFIRKYATLNQRAVFFSVFMPLLALWHSSIIAAKSKKNPGGKLTAVQKGVLHGVFGKL